MSEDDRAAEAVRVRRADGQGTPTVILITDPRWPLEHVTAVVGRAGRALERGRLCVQLRDKTAPVDALARAAEALRRATADAGALFTDQRAHARGPPRGDRRRSRRRTRARERDRLARAALGARGWISTPAHTDGDVSLAARSGASAVLVSPVYATPGKGPARGVRALEVARALADGCARDGSATAVLVYALGGVDASRAAACAAVGADGVAVIRALFEASNPGAVARLLDAPFHRQGASSAPCQDT